MNDEAGRPLLGARVESGGTRFGAYATASQQCSVRLYDPQGGCLATHPLPPRPDGPPGYFEGFVQAVGHGALYKLVLDGERAFPDPYARYLPQGVLGPAMVFASSYHWQHGPGLSRPLSDHVLYELHVGTFSPEGTYRGVAERAPALAELGVSAVELLPVAAFAGARGWGYDGVAWFAPFAPYGSPDDLRAMVDALHGHGLSVILDVVYNHFGPTGCFLREFAPDYFASAHKTAWGDGLDYQHPVVRRLVVENALYWLREFRFDGLRLDAIHAMVDPSPEHVLHELARSVAPLEPRRLLIAEDERNDPAPIRDLGLDALWADDFHHAVRVTLTAEQDGYFAAYRPAVATIAETIRNGWLYRGQISPTTGKPRGKPADGLDAASLIYCIQNHDQIGNRALGDRLASVTSTDSYRAVSCLLLFLPMTPLLFMGQEWASRTPFLFFTDHEPGIGLLISKGRREEFKGFRAFAESAARARIPDPQAVSSFERSRLSWTERNGSVEAQTLQLYRSLLALRRQDQVLRHNTRDGLAVQARGDLLVVERRNRHGIRVLALNLGPASVAMTSVLAGSTAHHLLLASDGSNGQRAQLPPSTAVIVALGS